MTISTLGSKMVKDKRRTRCCRGKVTVALCVLVPSFGRRCVWRENRGVFGTYGKGHNLPLPDADRELGELDAPPGDSRSISLYAKALTCAPVHGQPFNWYVCIF